MTKRLGTALLLAAALAVAAAGCARLGVPFGAPPPPKVVSGPPGLSLTPATFDDLPDWARDHHAQALPALRRSCSKLIAMPGHQAIGTAGIGGLAADWVGPCRALAETPDGNAAAVRYVLETWFTPNLATTHGSPDGLFTGYYEAELHASRKRSDRYRVPLYAPPPDLADVKARSGGRYYTRSQIEGGLLAGRGLELLWADDPVDVYFLQVQGSGRAVMDDGTTVRVGYAGDNGQGYVSIGRELVTRGLIAPGMVSMQSIRRWIAAHPEQGAYLMAQNPRYIFFREITGEGPIGAQGVLLTPGRSLAVDPAFVPLGVPIWVDTQDSGLPLRRLLVAQDTGNAIKGPVRGDIFFGFGPEAASHAGGMQGEGRYWLLLPRKPGRPTS